MQQTLQTVVEGEVAERTIPGAEGAAITLIRRGRAGTIASTGGMSEVLDELQHEAGYRPCLDAGRSNQTVHITHAATEARWLYATSPDNFTTAAQAFTALRTMSMNRNLKLSDLAAGIGAGADTFSGAVDTRPSIPPVRI